MTYNTPIACLIEDVESREARLLQVNALLRQARSIDEERDGIAFHFADEDGIVARLSEFVVAEHRCCPFLTFDLRIAPGHSGHVLRISGSRDSGMKAFIAETFVDSTER